MPNVWNVKTPCNGDWVDCALYVPHLAVTLAAANVAVDPFSYTSSPSPDITRDLEQMALLTGGWPYFGDEIRSVLKEVAKDAAYSYSIFYNPPAENWDGKWHKVLGAQGNQAPRETALLRVSRSKAGCGEAAARIGSRVPKQVGRSRHRPARDC
jgi:hypothetical protein